MRILIVEDKTDIRNSLKRNLEAEGFVVDAASDGLTGLELANLNEYDLIILDNVLPKLSGKEVCSTIRTTQNTVPILMLSVMSETNDKVEALNAGADDYLTKPFSFVELMARVRALLRRGSVVHDDVLTGNGITLDARRHIVKKDDVEIALTRKEFMLLEYFMRNRDAVLSRGMILEHVWDMNTDPFSNTIESHIRSLRKKLGETKEQTFIKTVPGYGYRFN